MSELQLLLRLIGQQILFILLAELVGMILTIVFGRKGVRSLLAGLYLSIQTLVFLLVPFTMGLSFLIPILGLVMVSLEKKAKWMISTFAIMVLTNAAIFLFALWLMLTS